MNFFKKIFGGLSSSFSEKKESKNEESKYLPDPEVPIDELFTMNFKNNGGKFLYCENEDELKETFISILEENDWFEREAITFENNLISFLDENKLIYRNPKNPTFLLCSCESLIAQDGSILFSSKQLLHYKSNDIPENIIVLAKTSQITKSKSDGLMKIKHKYSSNIPSNITTFQNFSKSNSDDFEQYGTIPRNLYLLLLEDL